MKAITVMAAYGRKYKTKAEAKKDWDEGKDFYTLSHSGFQNYGGRYCSSRDFQSEEIVTIQIYYDNNNKSFTFTNRE